MQFFLILTLNRLSSSLSGFVVVMPLKYLLGPVGDMYWFKIAAHASDWRIHFDFSSETAERNLQKFDREQDLIVL